jgi:hypothetical protein
MKWEYDLTEEDREAARERLYRPFRVLGDCFRKMFHCFSHYPREEANDIELEVRGSKLEIGYKDRDKRTRW